MALSWFRAADLQKLVVFCDFQIARATLCGLWAGRPSKTCGFLRFSNRPRDPLRTLGWSTFENSWFFCDFQIAHATLCGLWAGRPSKTRGFLRFSNRPRDTLGWSTFENSWFFAIFKSPARPFADFGLVDLRKLVVFCGFQIARATLCGLWAGRPSKTRGFLRFSIRPRDPLRSLGSSTFENLWFLCDFQFARATLCGVWAGRPSKTRGFCDFQIARATLCAVSRG